MRLAVDGTGGTGDIGGTSGAGEARQVRAARAKPAGQPATLRLTTAHFALYRAYLEGLEERTLHTHYGAPGTDVRVTRRTLATLRDTLTIAARRAGDRDAVHLLRLKPGSLPAEAHAGGAEGAAGEAAGRCHVGGYGRVR